MRNSKYLLFFLGMASLTFTGCSTSDNFAEAAADDIPQLTEDEKWVLEANSDVEIKLGTGGNQAFTRAIIPDATDGNFDTHEGIGMFCLAASQFGDASPIDWQQYKTVATSENDKKKRNEGRYMNWMGMESSDDAPINTTTWGGNVKANATKVTENKGELNEKTYTRIAWEDNFTRFYPMGNWYSYTFYGYHPYQSSVTTTDSKVSVDIPIDGYTDVLWGRSYKPTADEGESAAEVEDTWSQYAYSGRYFREFFKKNSKDAETPVMKFKHALSRLNFKIARGDEKEAEKGKLYLKRLVLLGDVPTSVTMTVADLTYAPNDNAVSVNSTEGLITAVGTSYNTVTVPDIDEDGGTATYNGVELKYQETWNEESKAYVRTEFSSQTGGKGYPLEYKELVVSENPSEKYVNYPSVGTGIIIPPTSTPDYQVLLTIGLDYKDGKSYEFTPQSPTKISFTGNKIEAGKQYNIYITVYTPEEIVVNAELVRWTEVDGSELEF